MFSLEQCKEITKQYDLLILLYGLVTLYVVFLMHSDTYIILLIRYTLYMSSLEQCTN